MWLGWSLWEWEGHIIVIYLLLQCYVHVWAGVLFLPWSSKMMIARHLKCRAAQPWASKLLEEQWYQNCYSSILEDLQQPQKFPQGKGLFIHLPREALWGYWSLHQLICHPRSGESCIRLASPKQGIVSGSGGHHQSHHLVGPTPSSSHQVLPFPSSPLPWINLLLISAAGTLGALPLGAETRH